MSLHYLVKLTMLIAHVLPLSCYRKNPRIYSTLTVAYKFVIPTSTIRERKDSEQQQMTYVKQRHLQTTDAAPAEIS